MVASEADRQRPRVATATLLLVPFLLSGAAALIAELCWLRALTVTLGGSSAALNIILITFMSGLAVGAALSQKVIRHTTRYLLLYAGLEAALSMYLLGSSFIISLVSRGFIQVLPVLGHETALEQLARLVVCGLALLPPTMAMGMTTPVLITAAVRSFRETAAHTGLLYGVNTLGAALGSFAAGAYLILSFGVERSLQIAAASNLLAALLVVAIFAVTRREASSAEIEARGGAPGEEPELAGAGPSFAYCALAALTGFAAMALEVIFARMLLFIIGSSYYSHTVIITGFLLGIVLGSLAIGLLTRLFVPQRSFLPVLFLLFGFSAIASGLLFEQLPLLLQHHLVEQDRISLHPLVVKLIAALLLVVLPAMISGMILPFLVHLLAQSMRDVTAGASNVLFFNTAGSVLGVALTGYVLIELVGCRVALLLMAGLIFLLAAYATARVAPWRPPRGPVTLAAASLGLLWVADRVVADENRPLIVHSVLYRELGRPQILYYREDEGASVSVVDLPERRGRALLINGLRAADLDAVYLGLGATSDVAMLSHRDPRSVFVAGVGSGKNAGVAGIYPSVEIDAVEISDAVIGSIPLFDAYTYGVSGNPQVRIIHGDARHFLQVAEEGYDVIIPDVYISALTGTAYLYNVEFFRLCAERLKPHGRVVLNVSLDSPIDRVIAASFLEAFPHVELVTIPYDGYSYLVGSNDPIEYPSAPWRGWQDRPELRNRMERLGFLGSRGLGDFRAMSDAELRTLLHDSPVSRDDHPIIDYINLFQDRRKALIW